MRERIIYSQGILYYSSKSGFAYKNPNAIYFNGEINWVSKLLSSNESSYTDPIFISLSPLDPERITPWRIALKKGLMEKYS